MVLVPGRDMEDIRKILNEVKRSNLSNLSTHTTRIILLISANLALQ